MQITILLKEGAVLFLGGDPAKSQAPLVTVSFPTQSQILIDQNKNTVVIVETK